MLLAAEISIHTPHAGSGLQRYGYEELAKTIEQDSLTLMEAGGFREYYDPRDGSGCGSTEFSWSAALTLELVSVGRASQSGPP